jgi:hypothetical protein
MPQLRKLSPDETQAIKDKGKSLRRLTEESFDRMLSDFELGDHGEVTLHHREKRQTIKNRVKAAGKRRGVRITFIPTVGDRMRFRVDEEGKQGNRRERDFQEYPTPVVPSLNILTGGSGQRVAKRLQEQLGDHVGEILFKEIDAPEEVPAKKKRGRPKKNP